MTQQIDEKYMTRAIELANKAELIETVAERVATLILAEYPVESCKIILRKLGAVPGTNSVGVVIERQKGIY